MSSTIRQDPKRFLKYILDEEIGSMITKIRTIIFPKSEVASMHGYIMNRIMQIPVIGNKGDTLELNITNNTKEVMIVRSGDIKSENVKLHYKKIMIMHLLPGETIHLRMEVTEGNGRTHPCYRRVSKAYMKKDGTVFYKPLRGYEENE